MEIEKKQTECDVLVLGGGPAGLSAAMYCGRARLETVVLEEKFPGGQAASTYHIANYPGTPGVVQGSDLTENMRRQAEEFGAKIISGIHIQSVELQPNPKIITTDGEEFHAKAVIIATGAQPRKLRADGAEALHGRGVHYCAICDAAFYQDKRVAVVGGGNSALQEAVFLTKFAQEVIVVHRLDHFQGSVANQEEVLKNPKIKVLWSTEITKVHGEDRVKGITLMNLAMSKEENLQVEAVFVYIGTEPKSELFAGQLELDEKGYIVTDCEMQTSVLGVLAAGDIREKGVRQAITAAGDGATAGINAEKYLTAMV